MPARRFIRSGPISDYRPTHEDFMPFSAANPSKKRGREPSEDPYGAEIATERPHKRARFQRDEADYSEADVVSLSAATSHGTSTIKESLPAYGGNSTTDKIYMTTPRHILPTPTTTMDGTNKPSISTFENPSIIKALLVKAESEAKLAAADAAREVRRVQNLLDASIEYSNAFEHQKMDAACSRADCKKKRAMMLEAKERVDALFLTPDKMRDLHYEINVRPPNDPEYRRWYWVNLKQKVVRCYYEAREVHAKAVKALESAEAKVKASEECLRAMNGLQARAWQELSNTVSSAEVLGAASTRAEEEVALLTVRFREAEDAARAEAAAAAARAETAAAAARAEAAAAAARAETAAAAARAEAAAAAAAARAEAAAAEAVKRKREEEKSASSKKARAGAMALSSDFINASRLNTLWAVVDVFDECNASQIVMQDDPDKEREKPSQTRRGKHGYYCDS
eukprot:g15354.t1